MTPLRLIIVGILLYIAFRMIFGGGRKKTETKKKGEIKEFPTKDVLVEDPVCHTLVPRQQAVTLDQEGKKVYFCSEECCKTYISQQGEQ